MFGSFLETAWRRAASSTGETQRDALRIGGTRRLRFVRLALPFRLTKMGVLLEAKEHVICKSPKNVFARM